MIKSKIAFAIGTLCLVVLFQNFTTINVSSNSVVTMLNDAATNQRPIVGLNLNHWTDGIDAVKTKRLGFRWYRVYVRMLDFVDYDRKMQNVKKDKNYKYVLSERDQLVLDRVESLRKLQDDPDFKTILSLRWDFVKRNIPVPAENSDDEKFYFDSAVRMINTYASRSSIIVVGNEPTLETEEQQQEIREDKPGKPIDVVVFYRRLATRIHKHLVDSGRRQNVALLLGSLNRLDIPANFNSDVVRRFIFQAQNMDIIDGLDVHIHVPSMQAFERYLNNVRNLSLNGRGFTKQLIVTEFTLVWAVKKNFNSPLCEGERGIQFCRDYKLINMTELEYMNSLLLTKGSNVENRASRAEWGDFLLSRSYLPQNFLRETNQLFKKYQVSMATFGAGNSKIVDEASYYKQMQPDDIPWIWGMYNQRFVQPNENGQPVPNNFYTRGLKFVTLDERR